MKKQTYKVNFNQRDIPAVLDMMRYEGAQVVAWERVDDDRFVVTLTSDWLTRNRWLSFMLVPRVVD